MRRFDIDTFGFFLSIAFLVVSGLRVTDALAGPSHPQRNNGVVITKEEAVVLPNGIEATIVTAFPPEGQSSPQSEKPPILFLHGSFHGAWCWQEHYMPYFAEKGHMCVAFNWRGTGGNPAEDGAKKVKIVEDHCDDLRALLEALPSILNIDNDSKSLPIVVSHSMGGIIVMKYLDEIFATDRSNTKPNQVFSGIVSMCSVPPSGNSKTTMRYLRRSPLDAYKITVGFVFKKVITDDTICRDCFFGGDKKFAGDATIEDFGISDQDLARYQRYFERDSRSTLDVMDLAKRAPSKTADEDGRAPFLVDLPPSLVIGATDDFIVDKVANAETANYYGVDEPVYVDSPHDVMLGRNWENGARALNNWIEETMLTSK